MPGRQSDPALVHQVWDAIENCMTQRQQPNFERVSKYVMRNNAISPEDFEQELNKVVADGLVRFLQRLGAKGSKKGEEQELYKLPKGPPPASDHDWYCGTCHQPGEVLPCTTCTSVHHSKCLTESQRQEPFKCPQCQNSAAEKCDIKKKTLNTLLGYTVLRLKARMLPLTVAGAGVLSPSSDPEQKFRTEFLLYRPLEIYDIEDKLDRQVYSKISDFENDVRLMVHNIVVMNGAESQAASVASQVLQDCLYDIQEIRICRDCYRMSNEKPGKNWFCRPCRPPHQLVYAKQKGYPFWPAKVMKIENEMYDVRFFGEPHERAIVSRSQIRPITTSLQAMQIKRTNPWLRSQDELKRHQAALQKAEKSGDAPGSDSGSDSEPEKEPEPDPEAAGPPPAKRRRRAFDTDEDGTVEVKDCSIVVQKVENDSEPDPAVGSMSSCSSGRGSLRPHSRRAFEVMELHPRSPPEETESQTEGGDGQAGDEKSSADPGGDQTGPAPPAPDDQVTSSSQEPRARTVTTQTPVKFLRAAMLEQSQANGGGASAQTGCEDRLRQLEREMEKARLAHKQELAALEAQHRAQLTASKRKQWCYNCEQEAIYHCCWNTAYCSTDCQQLHWHKEHKRVCRRKRTM
ncbi:zinc finger MYND domain-containing protein 11-like isoform X1 [Amphibalanus amphitrite]|uniref:zinc finger MYND domain-containing protein 11-like isoform X1 n=1 Tax=Amphibalanus amphitrite TaxID=1232801 RepID=UPI001C923620|nr:zinc finger MYND domain-containing protein 11-like isoform X1 [Amphibalanus amphitrite]